MIVQCFEYFLKIFGIIWKSKDRSVESLHSVQNKYTSSLYLKVMKTFYRLEWKADVKVMF